MISRVSKKRFDAKKKKLERRIEWEEATPQQDAPQQCG